MDKSAQLFIVGIEVIAHHIAVNRAFYHFVYLFELLCCMVRWSDIPIEVVLVKHIEHAIVGYESYFFCIESS